MNLNNYPNGYQPMPPYYSQGGYNQPNYNQSNASTNNNIIWVQGLEGAKSYLVAPNSTVYLWDSESTTIYVKSADASGVPSIKIIDYKYREDKDLSKEYVTQSDFDKFKKDIMKKLEVTNE